MGKSMYQTPASKNQPAADSSKVEDAVHHVERHERSFSDDGNEGFGGKATESDPVGGERD